jgi:hypothetical protein
MFSAAMDRPKTQSQAKDSEQHHCYYDDQWILIWFDDHLRIDWIAESNRRSSFLSQAAGSLQAE